MEKELTEMEVAATCMTQHVKIFRKQTLEDRIADFGEPCSSCPIQEYCIEHGMNGWLSRMEPILKESKVEFSMCLR